MHTLTTSKFGSVRKPWTTFNVKHILEVFEKPRGEAVKEGRRALCCSNDMAKNTFFV